MCFRLDSVQSALQVVDLRALAPSRGSLSHKQDRKIDDAKGGRTWRDRGRDIGGPRSDKHRLFRQLTEQRFGSARRGCEPG